MRRQPKKGAVEVWGEEEEREDKQKQRSLLLEAKSHEHAELGSKSADGASGLLEDTYYLDDSSTHLRGCTL